MWPLDKQPEAELQEGSVGKKVPPAQTQQADQDLVVMDYLRWLK